MYILHTWDKHYTDPWLLGQFNAVIRGSNGDGARQTGIAGGITIHDTIAVAMHDAKM